MRDLYYLTEDQMAVIRPYFPSCRGVCRVDDRRVLSGIVHVLKRGLQWRDAPSEYGPHKTLYNRFIRWSEKGVFKDIFRELSMMEGLHEELQIDATHLRAHRTAASLLKKGINLGPLDEQSAA